MTMVKHSDELACLFSPKESAGVKRLHLTQPRTTRVTTTASPVKLPVNGPEARGKTRQPRQLRTPR
jgi:hypothetical protein